MVVTPDKHRFTMDVKGSYIDNPNSDGLAALWHFLDKQENQSISVETLVRLAELVLTKDCFEFDGQFYSQSGVTMIGTPYGVENSGLFIRFEKENQSRIRRGKPQLHKRFINNIFVLHKCRTKNCTNTSIVYKFITKCFNTCCALLKKWICWTQPYQLRVTNSTNVVLLHI